MRRTLITACLAPLLAGAKPTGVASNHWSLQPVSKSAPPTQGGSWAIGGIDAFVSAGLAEHGLKPSARAERRTLIRRLYLVMHGLRPTLEQVETFVADNRPAAWETAVDKVLASPRFGERWARHWLDVVRFAESNGFETNRERPTAYHFRDYIIKSFNDDKPYDQLIREHLAGDALGADVGTGFLVAGPHDIVKSPDPNLTLTQRQDELADMANTAGTAFLGLTLGCARCHDHKFDPVTQKDYYAIQAIFAGVRHGERPLPSLDSGDDGLRPAVSALGNDEQFAPTEASFVRFTVRSTSAAEPCIDELEIFDSNGQNVALAAKPSSSGDYAGNPKHQLQHINDGKFGNSRSWISNESGKGWVALQLTAPTEIERIRWARDREGKFSDRLATDYVIEASLDGERWQTIASSQDRQPSSDVGGKAWIGTFTQPGSTHLLYRGDAMAKREVVDPDGIALFGSLGMAPNEAERQRRLKFANWIASPENPLTARVMANRLWQYTFGVGLVDTPSDFGGNGTLPTHPELLDWLAAEFVESGWSIKTLLRQMLLSETFQQSSAPRPSAAKIDAGGRYLWRFSPRRLEAEAIRDSVLSVAGTLDLKMGGPGFYLLDVDRENVVHYHPKAEIGPAEWRRMVYLFKIRQEQDAIFGAFDCPDGNQVIPERSRSTTPLQALNLFNSPFIQQQAGMFADRIRGDSTISNAFHLAYGRPPTAEESQDALSFIANHGLNAFCRALLNTNEFLFVF